MQKRVGVKLPSFLDKKPDLKKKIAEVVGQTPLAKRKQDIEKLKQFFTGELSWVEVKQLPRRYINEMAKIATMEFKLGHLKRAEAIFKGLCVIDHKTAYHHRALGAVYQKQKNFESAVEKYNMALVAKENDISTLVNRGECYLHLNNKVQALADLNAAINLDKNGKNPWANRARVLVKGLKQ
ncbi:hypothetical protein K1X76_08425 [bacterium]|nr:hypothetical protein [bacterium]